MMFKTYLGYFQVKFKVGTVSKQRDNESLTCSLACCMPLCPRIALFPRISGSCNTIGVASEEVVWLIVVDSLWQLRWILCSRLFLTEQSSFETKRFRDSEQHSRLSPLATAKECTFWTWTLSSDQSFSTVTGRNSKYNLRFKL